MSENAEVGEFAGVRTISSSWILLTTEMAAWMTLRCLITTNSLLQALTMTMELLLSQAVIISNVQHSSPNQR